MGNFYLGAERTRGNYVGKKALKYEGKMPTKKGVLVLRKKKIGTKANG